MFFTKRNASSIISEQLKRVKEAIEQIQEAIELNQGRIDANKATVEKIAQENQELHSETIFASRLKAKLQSLVEE